MNYKLLNEIEKVIEACCIGGIEDAAIEHESGVAADGVAYEVGRLLYGVEITDKDWTLICANIQSGFARAATQAMRIIGASNGMGVVTHE